MLAYILYNLKSRYMWYSNAGESSPAGVTPHFREEGTISAPVSWRSVMYQVCQASALQASERISPF